MVHPRESDVHAVHPTFYTLHTPDLTEFRHALQTGALQLAGHPDPK